MCRLVWHLHKPTQVITGGNRSVVTQKNVASTLDKQFEFKNCLIEISEYMNLIKTWKKKKGYEMRRGGLENHMRGEEVEDQRRCGQSDMMHNRTSWKASEIEICEAWLSTPFSTAPADSETGPVLSIYWSFLLYVFILMV